MFFWRTLACVFLESNRYNVDYVMLSVSVVFRLHLLFGEVAHLDR